MFKKQLLRNKFKTKGFSNRIVCDQLHTNLRIHSIIKAHVKIQLSLRCRIIQMYKQRTADCRFHRQKVQLTWVAPAAVPHKRRYKQNALPFAFVARITTDDRIRSGFVDRFTSAP